MNLQKFFNYVLGIKFAIIELLNLTVITWILFSFFEKNDITRIPKSHMCLLIYMIISCILQDVLYELEYTQDQYGDVIIHNIFCVVIRIIFTFRIIYDIYENYNITMDMLIVIMIDVLDFLSSNRIESPDLKDD
jgi:hypothetical protein